MEIFLNRTEGGDAIAEYITNEGDKAFKFHKYLSGYKETPVFSLKSLSKKLGLKNIYVKDESDRFGLNAFKVLGASYAIHRILDKDPSITTFCTATDGNHGKAVAWSAKKFNKKAVIFIPDNTVPARINSIKKEGADTIIVNGNYDEAVRRAREEAGKNNWALVQDSSWQGYEEIPGLIVSGYMTMFRELEEKLHKVNLPGVDFIFLQAGVGSFPASAVLYYTSRYKENAPGFVCVEPEKADCLYQSAKAGKLAQAAGSLDSIMAGLNCGIPSKSAWEILKYGANAFMTIPDEYAEKAVRRFYYPAGDDSQIISGESGAAGLGGLLALINEESFKEAKDKIGLNENSRVLIFNTEGNTDPTNFKKIISLRKCFT